MHIRRLFVFEKATKNKRLYTEHTPDPHFVAIGKLYITKESAEWLGNPNVIEVTISTVPNEAKCR